MLSMQLSKNDANTCKREREVGKIPGRDRNWIREKCPIWKDLSFGWSMFGVRAHTKLTCFGHEEDNEL